MSKRKAGGKHHLQLDDDSEEEGLLGSPEQSQRHKKESSQEEMEIVINSSGDEAEDGENAPRPLERQRDAAVARMQRLFGLEVDEIPSKPLVQDDETNYLRKMYWTCVLDSGFPNRVNHAVASTQNEQGEWFIYSFGGYHVDDDDRTVLQADSQGGPAFRSSPIDVYACDVASRTWTCMEPPPQERYYNVEPFQRAKIPGCRYGHTACAYNGRIYMFGGRNDDDGSFSTMECYDTVNNIWIRIMVSGDQPGSRDGQACTSLGPYMYIHGGFSATDIKFIGDTYIFNMETHIWKKLPRKGYYVPERDFHTATAIVGSRNNKLVVFGGRSDKFYPYFTANDTYDDQIYSYNLDTFKWKKRRTTGYQPKGRRSHCAVNMGTSVLIFGGYNAVHKQHFGDLFSVDTETWHITEIRPFGMNPCPRRRVGCAKVGDEIVICGGTSPTTVLRNGKEREILHDHNDVYILHLIPTLQQLCTMVVIEQNLTFSSLPVIMQKHIEEQLGRKLVTITKMPMLPES